MLDAANSNAYSNAGVVALGLQLSSLKSFRYLSSIDLIPGLLFHPARMLLAKLIIQSSTNSVVTQPRSRCQVCKYQWYLLPQLFVFRTNDTDSTCVDASINPSYPTVGGGYPGAVTAKVYRMQVSAVPTPQPFIRLLHRRHTFRLRRCKH
jgi:hypothetical protein